MQYDTITKPAELQRLCDELSQAERIAFDTEFVAEHTYRPQLCLVQVAWADRMAIIDTMELVDITPFWEALASPGHVTLVHAGREEIGFSLAAIGRPPANLLDIQIAAGMVGYEYPAGYGSLVGKLLGAELKKGETRTDWRRRPLSQQQLNYALIDVLYLEEMADKLLSRVDELKRREWLDVEMRAWVAQVEEAFVRERWRRVSGINGLGPRGLAIIRELWRWREEEAGRRDKPVKRILRDDLMVEMAKRRSADPKQIRAVRGMERGDLRDSLPQIAQRIQVALEMSDDELPRGSARNHVPPQVNVLGQFLSSALGSICRRASIAASMVGNPSDVRELIAYRLGYFRDGDDPPSLAVGWRAEVVGNLIEDLLVGKVSIRIDDPRSDYPLVFERIETVPQRADG